MGIYSLPEYAYTLQSGVLSLKEEFKKNFKKQIEKPINDDVENQSDLPLNLVNQEENQLIQLVKSTFISYDCPDNLTLNPPRIIKDSIDLALRQLHRKM